MYYSLLADLYPINALKRPVIILGHTLNEKRLNMFDIPAALVFPVLAAGDGCPLNSKLPDNLLGGGIARACGGVDVGDVGDV